MNKVSVYIIAYNEAEKIRSAVQSVLWADEIVVADSHSQDDTAAIAESLGARVVQIEFRGFGDLRNQAMAACSHDWIFSLDADERCTPEARDEIRTVLHAPQSEAYYIPRKNFFMGRWMRHSGFYPDYRQPQLFRKGVLVFKDDPVHEEYTVLSKHPAAYLRNPIWQFPFKNLEEVVHKANKYSTLGAEKLAKKGRKATMGMAVLHGIWAFFHMYILKRGVLDGWPGLVIAIGNFEGTFYKYAKLLELGADWTPPSSPPLR
ncbi:glycosyltransferase family 2 protein [Desulfobulbus alkaliphilus]|uniref:glycosyltransferase family 2 protein n=1 Tax=Desulfobulbus alkaliphilus TaxID=869814 RepID=UPI0019659826|nr:glycosyltransferase family 2 protein [Desulfobulbus alkaliphilus]MBM9537967.1 glycosyltransferase family 2 protein [Desulfobulbus alkaliphilus]